MALRQLPAVVAVDVRHVRVDGQVGAERAQDVDLRRRVRDVILAADHVRDLVDDVVDRADEVVGRPPVGADDHEVGQQLVPELDAAAHGVVPRDDALLRLAEADRALVLVRLALSRPARSASSRALSAVSSWNDTGPSQSIPSQRSELLDLLDRLGDLAARVGVLDPQQALAALLAREEPVEEERPDAADVEEAGRARSHADADGRDRSIVGRGGIRRAHLLERRDRHGDRPDRGDRRRLRAGLHAEPAHVAADEPQARGDRAVSREACRGRHRRRRLPRALPRATSRRPDEAICEKSVDHDADHGRRGGGDRRRRGDLPRRLAPRRRLRARARPHVHGARADPRAGRRRHLAADGELRRAPAERSGGRSRSCRRCSTGSTGIRASASASTRATSTSRATTSPTATSSTRSSRRSTARSASTACGRCT